MCNLIVTNDQEEVRSIASHTVNTDQATPANYTHDLKKYFDDSTDLRTLKFHFMKQRHFRNFPCLARPNFCHLLFLS